jgi:hypothetical protein
VNLPGQPSHHASEPAEDKHLNQPKGMGRPMAFRLRPEDRAALSRLALGLGLEPGVLARQFVLDGLRRRNAL